MNGIAWAKQNEFLLGSLVLLFHGNSLKCLVARFYFVYRRNYLTTTRTEIAEYIPVYIAILLLNRDLFQRNFVPSNKIYRNIGESCLCVERKYSDI